MEPFYETEWLGVKFSDISKLSRWRLPSDGFSAEIYSEVLAALRSPEDLPHGYENHKKGVARDIASLIPRSESVLSIGSGLGIVEKELAEQYAYHLTALEPHLEEPPWASLRVEYVKGYFPEALPDFEVDSALLSAVDYALDEAAWRQLLGNIFDFPIDRVVLADLPMPRGYRSVAQSVGDLARLFGRRRQFWGWLRGIDEQILLLTEAGFSNFQVGKHSECDHFWIMGRRS